MPLSAQRHLDLLRSTLAAGERALVGLDAITAYLAQIGWVTREGYPPTARTLERWMRDRGFPVTYVPGRAGTRARMLWTTTYAVTAWLLAGAGGLASRYPQRYPGSRRRSLSGEWTAMRGHGGRPVSLSA